MRGQVRVLDRPGVAVLLHLYDRLAHGLFYRYYDLNVILLQKRKGQRRKNEAWFLDQRVATHARPY